MVWIVVVVSIMVVGNAIDRGVVGMEVDIVVLVREDQELKMIAFFFLYGGQLFYQDRVRVLVNIGWRLDLGIMGLGFFFCVV